MRKPLQRLAWVFGILLLVLGGAGYWCLKVAPVTVINLSNMTIGDISIDLEGKMLAVGTLAPYESNKVYGIPGGSEMIGISFVLDGRPVRRELDYIGGLDGQPEGVVILSPTDIRAISIPGLLLK
jgi:hypothetical protein